MAEAPLTVFISYRREDSAGFTGRLADTLRRELDEGGEVLRDVDEMIAPGADFRAAIVEAIERAGAVVAVIGPRWLTASDVDGSRRLDAERDVVKLELVGALDRGIPVIPVLVDGADMPAAGDLPSELAALATRNAIELTDSRWEGDSQKLIGALRAYAGATADENLTAQLPTPPTALVGRERELEQVASLLAADARLITLTGPGGIGKTRVSLEAARRAADRFDRVVFCDLTTVDDAELVIPAIARAAGVEHSGDGRLIEVVGRDLAGGETLLVLDNFEHVLEAGSQVAEVLSLAPGVRALVTSRAALRVSGEREQPVAPLAEVEATALFTDRALAVKPDLDVDAAREAIAGICERLDGLPLAIELAAARVRLLSPEAMLGHLEERLTLLTHGPQDLPERQQTVRATIEWSYRLLDEPDRALLGRMSAFAGGASLDAIQAVCDPDGSPIEVLDRLQALSENSLIFTLADQTGDQRFRMLELIREFACSMVVVAGEAETIGRRHAFHFGEFVDRQGPEFDGADLIAAFAIFDADYPNLTEALGWARDNDEVELELTLVGWLGEYWYMRGYYLEPWPWVAHALSHTGGSPARRARVMRGAGSMRSRMGDDEGAQDLFQSSLEICEELGDRSGAARSLSGLEGCFAANGEYERAEQAGARALEIVQELGEWHRVAFAAANAGYTAMEREDLVRARAMLDESLRVARDLGNPEAISNAEQNLGLLSLLDGDLDAAARLTAAGLRGAIELREHLGILAGLVVVAAVRARRSDAPGAAELLGLVEAELDVREYVLDPVEAQVREATLAAVRAQLDDATMQAAIEGGKQLDLIAATNEAIAALHARP